MSVSVSKQKGGDALSLLLPIASDPEGTSRRLAELTEATAAYTKAVERHGKADEIDAILARVKSQSAEAAATLRDAKAKAKAIVREAEVEAAGIVERASAEMAEQRKILKASQSRLRDRETAVKEKESAIEPLWAEATSALEKAKKRESDAAEAGRDFRDRVNTLKKAIQAVS